MNTVRFAGILSALLLSGCAVVKPINVADDVKQTASSIEGQPVIIGITYTIPSKILGMNRRLTVRLPNGYGQPENAERTYPVLYLIDGGPEQDYPHIAGLAQLSDVNQAFGEFILVGVETIERRAEISPPVADPEEYKDFGSVPGGSENFRTFLRLEVIPWANNLYRTSGRNALIGESLAGLFTLETFLREPTLFDDYVSVSPSIWWEKMEYAKRAPEFLAKQGASDRTLLIYMDDVGYWTEEGTLMLVKTLEQHAPKGLKWAFFDLGNVETHQTIFHRAAFDAIRALYQAPSRVYREHPIGSGLPFEPRTPEMEARAAKKCDLTNSRRTTPAKTRQHSDDLFYACLLYDYGDIAERGNWSP